MRHTAISKLLGTTAGAHLLETVTKLEVSRAKIEAIPR